MENRGALCFLAGTLSRQPHQRRQSARTRDSSCAQPRRQRTSSGGLHLTEKPKLSRGAVPTSTQQARCPQSYHCLAHRLARLVYRMLKYGQQYVDKGAEYYERRNRQQQIEFLRKKAAHLGLQLAPAHP